MSEEHDLYVASKERPRWMDLKWMYIRDSVGSHLPVLDLVKRLAHVRRILEFGTGEYSTNKLLEFPDLELLTSYEDKQDWFNKIAKVEDGKFKLVFERDLLSLSKTIPLDEFDLIFIDCCVTSRERSGIIREIAKRKPRAVVIIHDFDDILDEFPESIEEFDNRAVYGQFFPATGILWNQIEGSAKVRNVKFEGIQKPYGRSIPTISG